MRAGVLGGIVSFLGFTLPSVIALIIFALMVQGLNIDAGWIHGLKIVAVAVVAHAILGMAQKLTPDLKRKALALFALIVTLLWQTAFTQVGVIVISAIIGFILYKQHTEHHDDKRVYFPISRGLAVICLSFFLVYLSFYLY